MSSASSERRAVPWRPLVLLGLVAGVLLATRALGLGEALAALRDWIEGLGRWGVVAFIALYALAVTVAVPASALTVAAGALFGSLVGVAVVNVAATIGASLAFLLARHFARDATARWLRRKERFQRLDALTERHGAVIVLFTRLVPLFPFTLLNYGFGLTRVRFSTYVLWTWLGTIPGTVLYVVGADAVIRAATSGEIPWGLGAAVAAGAALVFVLARAARRRLGKDDPAVERR